MTVPSRRGFLKATGVGVAAAGVVAATGVAAAAQTSAAAPALPASAKREILAHVLDVDAGTIALMVEGHAVTVTDPALAAHIASVLHTHAAPAGL